MFLNTTMFDARESKYMGFYEGEQFFCANQLGCAYLQGMDGKRFEVYDEARSLQC